MVDSKLRFTSVLVTGATGLLGSYLMAELSERTKLPLKGLCRNKRKTEIPYRVFQKTGKENKFSEIEWIEGNILDEFFLDDIITPGTLVIHAAGMVSFLPKDREEMMQINYLGTKNVVNACLGKENVRLCHVSSIAVLRNKNKSKILDETDFNPPDPSENAYHISKYLAELEVWRGMEEGLDMVVCNPGLILAGICPDQSSGMLLKKAKKTGFFYPTGSTGILFAEDAARAITEIAFSSYSSERFILIENNYSYRELFSMLNNYKIRIPLGRSVLKSVAMANSILHRIFRIPVFISFEMARSSTQKSLFSNEKFKNSFPGFEFIKINRDTLSEKTM
jgi:nucleoside-diphosphate-sugar epimerase